MSEPSSLRPVRESLQEYGRGIAGGLLFSLPLLYTMEVWWQGFVVQPLWLLIYVLVTFALLLAYNRYAGLHASASFAEVAIDSVEELGLGLLISASVLWLLHRITPEMPVIEIMAKVIIEAMTVAIGVSVGTAELGGGSEVQQDQNQQKNENSPAARDNLLELIAIATCGAILVAANLGPTEEIKMLAIEAPITKLLALACISVLLSVLIVYYSDFRGARHSAPAPTPFLIAQGTAVTYAVALFVSAGMCWFFGHFDGTSLEVMVSQTVVLAFPATLGASAGRLLLQAD